MTTTTILISMTIIKDKMGEKDNDFDGDGDDNADDDLLDLRQLQSLLG